MNHAARDLLLLMGLTVMLWAGLPGCNVSPIPIPLPGVDGSALPQDGGMTADKGAADLPPLPDKGAPYPDSGVKSDAGPVPPDAGQPDGSQPDGMQDGGPPTEGGPLEGGPAEGGPGEGGAPADGFPETAPADLTHSC